MSANCLIILGSPLGPKSQADLLEKKINELEKDNGIVEKLDAHYGFLCWKIASVCKSCCTSWEPVHVLIIQLSWNSMTKRYATGFPKCVMWTSTIFRVLSLLCPLKCIIISTSRLFGLNFWCEWLSHDDFLETFEDVSFTKALEKCLSLTNEQESPLDGTQKKWMQPVFVKTAQNLISRMDDNRSKVPPPEEPCTSKATGWNMYPLSINSRYFSILRASASVVPGLHKEPWFRRLGARASPTVTSHTSCLPIFQGIMVTPSGHLPLVRYSQRGSSIEGKWRDPNVCFIRELRVAWREKRPALLVQKRPCKPSLSTLLPQWHVCATQTLAPRRKPIEIRSCWLLSFRPMFLQGTTFRH